MTTLTVQAGRYLGEVHAECERNFQAWKVQAEALNSAESKPGSAGRTESKPGSAGRTVTPSLSANRGNSQKLSVGKAEVTELLVESVVDELQFPKNENFQEPTPLLMTPRRSAPVDEHRMA
jgi:hypothetical protein